MICCSSVTIVLPIVTYLLQLVIMKSGQSFLLCPLLDFNGSVSRLLGRAFIRQQVTATADCFEVARMIWIVADFLTDA